VVSGGGGAEKRVQGYNDSPPKIDKGEQKATPDVEKDRRRKSNSSGMSGRRCGILKGKSCTASGGTVVLGCYWGDIEPRRISQPSKGGGHATVMQRAIKGEGKLGHRKQGKVEAD